MNFFISADYSGRLSLQCETSADHEKIRTGHAERRGTLRFPFTNPAFYVFSIVYRYSGWKSSGNAESYNLHHPLVPVRDLAVLDPLQFFIEPGQGRPGLLLFAERVHFIAVRY